MDSSLSHRNPRGGGASIWILSSIDFFIFFAVMSWIAAWPLDFEFGQCSSGDDAANLMVFFFSLVSLLRFIVGSWGLFVLIFCVLFGWNFWSFYWVFRRFQLGFTKGFFIFEREIFFLCFFVVFLRGPLVGFWYCFYGFRESWAFLGCCCVGFSSTLGLFEVL